MKTRLVKVDSIVEFHGGGTPSKSRPQYYTGDIPWVSPKDMKSWYILDSEEHITQEAVDNSATKLIPKNSILIVNRSGVLKHTLPIAINKVPVTINQDMKALVCSDEVDPEYLARALKGREKQILMSVRATTADNFSVNVLKDFELPLPPLDEQRRIAAILDKADGIRRKRQAALTLADEFLRSVFLDMFGDPVTNPKGWPTRKFGAESVGELDRGKSKHRPRNDPALLGGKYPLIQTGEISNSNGYIADFTHTYSEFGLAQSKLWPKGTLCITIAANIAKTAILLIDACFPDSVVGFTPNDAVKTEYVQFWLSFLQQIIEKNAPVSAQKNINLEILRELDIPCPSIELQEQFVTQVQKSNVFRKKLYKANDLANDAFHALVQRAFRGEL